MAMPVANRSLYFLKNPLTCEVFYVGIGLPGRKSIHTKKVAKGFTIKQHDLKSLYIKGLLDTGQAPIEETVHPGLSKNHARMLERQYIAHYGRLDLGTGQLTNRTSGGEWINDCPKTDEWKKNASASQLKVQNTAETKAKKSKALKGLKRTPEQIEHIRLSQLLIRDQVSKARMGGSNPAAKPCYVNGALYPSIGDAAQALGAKRHHLRSKRFELRLESAHLGA